MRPLRFLLVLGLLAAVPGCGEDSVAPPPAAPDIPDVRALQFNLDFFEDNYLGDTAPGVLSAAHGVNFGGAAVKSTGMAVVPMTLLPRVEAALAVAADIEPHWVGAGYEWIFTVQDEAVSVVAHLTARWVDQGEGPADWRWSCGREVPGGLSGTWFTIEPDADGRTGTLVLHQPETDGLPPIMRCEYGGEEGLTVEFTRLDASGEPRERFTYERVGDDHELRREGEDFLYVTWNGEARSGSVHAPDFFRGQRACWDHTLADVFCDFIPDGGD